MWLFWCFSPELDKLPELCCSSQLYSRDPRAALPARQPDGSWVFCPDLPPALPLIYSLGQLCDRKEIHCTIHAATSKKKKTYLTVHSPYLKAFFTVCLSSGCWEPSKTAFFRDRRAATKSPRDSCTYKHRMLTIKHTHALQNLHDRSRRK